MFLGEHIHMLELAHDVGCQLGSRVATAAAACGHLHTLQWLQAHGCKMDEGMPLAAACGGHLDVLKWARASGIAIPDRVCGIEEMLETSSVNQPSQSEIFLVIRCFGGARGEGVCTNVSMRVFEASSKRVSIPRV